MGKRLRRIPIPPKFSIPAFYLTLFALSFTITLVVRSWRRGSYAPLAKPAIKLLGVGTWLWQPSRVACNCKLRHARILRPKDRAAHYASIAETTARYGFDTVYVKMADGTKPFPLYDDTIIEAYRRRGVQVAVWSYNYCNSPRVEAALIHSYLHKPGVIAYVANTEVHVKNKSRKLEAMMQHLTWLRDSCASCRHKLIGYAPYAFPYFHRTLDYAVLNRYSDFVAPQVYPATMKRRTKVQVKKGRKVKYITRTKWAVDTMFDQWSRFEKAEELAGRSRAIPICPLGQSYGRVQPGEISDFVRRTKGYHAISFWDLQHAKPWMLEEIRQAKRRWRG